MIKYINEYLLSPIMVFILTAVGIYMSFKIGFIQFRKLGMSICETFHSLFKKNKNKGITPFQAIATALSSTLGTGNIVGVASAIFIGGAGSIFWMWVSSFLGMAVKYSEVVLAVKYKTKKNTGGPMFYLEKKSKLLSIFFSIACIISSFGIGNMVQANAINQSIKTVFNINTKPLFF